MAKMGIIWESGGVIGDGENFPESITNKVSYTTMLNADCSLPDKENLVAPEAHETAMTHNKKNIL